MPIDGENITLIIPTSTTVEIKCGAYRMVCEALRSFDVTSFSSSARIIGSGKLTTIEYSEIISVFFISRQK